jgi:phosphotransferase system HPr (HPr) family protein
MFRKPATRRVKIARDAGLHARPSLAIVKTLARFQAKVEICCESGRADGRSVLELLALGAGRGTELLLTAQGADAEEALDTLVNLFETDFGIGEEEGS